MESIEAFALKICDVEAEVEEQGGKSYFTITIEKKDVYDYCKTILENGICPALLDMRFIEEGTSYKAYYDFGGYVQLRYAYRFWKDEKKDVALESISMINSIVKCILQVENYLFMSKGYRVNIDSVFINKMNGGIRLAFIPETEETRMSKKLIRLIKDMTKIACDEKWCAYGNEIADKVISCEDSISVIEKKLIEKSREITINCWPQLDALRL